MWNILNQWAKSLLLPCSGSPVRSAVSAMKFSERPTSSMDSHAVTRYGGSTAFPLAATGSSQSVPFCTALLSFHVLRIEAFHMVLNLAGLHGLGRAVPGTTRIGIVGI